MNPITKEGEILLREELKKLKSEDRPRIIDAIATAREFGDLKENAEYHAAKEEQSLAEARIRDIESKLSSAQVIDVTSIESSDKVGGIIDSFESEGYTCENGPNTVLNNNMVVQELIDDLNLSEEIIYPNEQGVKNRYVLLNGKPTKIPLTFYDFFSTPLLSFFSKLRILVEVFIPRHKKNTDVKSFISRRFGSEFHDKLIVPFLTGIYADDTKFMSAKHTLKNIWELEQKYGSVILGMIKMKRKSKPKIFTLLGGLSKLTDILKLKFDDKILF